MQLAAALSGMSTGRQPSLWGELRQEGSRIRAAAESYRPHMAATAARVPKLLFVAGSRDKKFVNIAKRMAAESGLVRDGLGSMADEIEILGGGDGPVVQGGLGVEDAMRVSGVEEDIGNRATFGPAPVAIPARGIAAEDAGGASPRVPLWTSLERGFVKVRSCGHAVHVERPEALISILASFLALEE